MAEVGISIQAIRKAMESTKSCDDKASGNALDRAKVDSHFTQRRIDEPLKDWDHYHNRDRVEILDQIVRSTCDCILT
jgi:hypothetical protein